ncbi:MAG: hypothetical protein Q4F05_11020 [bacterium]|nr:hypothetical protein [bacterium]
MDINDCITDYLIKVIENDTLNNEHKNQFVVCLNYLYKASKDDQCKNVVYKIANQQCSQETFGYSDSDLGTVLYDCYLETNNLKYRKAIELFMSEVNSKLQSEWKDFFKSEECKAESCVDRLHKMMPFYMAYETAFHNKENYNEIVDTFLNVNSYLDLHNKYSLHVAAVYAMTLIDTLDVMSKEIFEHYKTLETLCKTSIKQILEHIKNENKLIYQTIDKSEIDKSTLSDLARVAYVLLKACRMRVLLPEKYQTTGMDLYDFVCSGVDNIMEQEYELMAMSILAYAEKLMLESN